MREAKKQAAGYYFVRPPPAIVEARRKARRDERQSRPIIAMTVESSVRAAISSALKLMGAHYRPDQPCRVHVPRVLALIVPHIQKEISRWWWRQARVPPQRFWDVRYIESADVHRFAVFVYALLHSDERGRKNILTALTLSNLDAVIDGLMAEYGSVVPMPDGPTKYYG